MKYYYLLRLLFVLCLVNAYSQTNSLTIYDTVNQTGNSASINQTTIYIGNSIPGGLNDKISSIKLQPGNVAVLAENEDGTGFSKSLIATTNEINYNLSIQLDNLVSFIRVMPFTNVNKKGLGLGAHNEFQNKYY